MNYEDRTNHIKCPSNNINEIDFNQIIPIDDYNDSSKSDDSQSFNIAKVMIDSKESTRRIIEKCEVKCYIQKYLCSSEDNSLKLVNKEYKNILKISIEKMKKEDATLRKCLLNLFDKQMVWIIIHKDFDKILFQNAMKDLKQTDSNKFNTYIYYKIIIESVIYPQPTEPKSLHLYDRFIRTYQEEIRYFISIENFTEAISWCNKITNSFFKMNKELKKQMTDEIWRKLLPEMKSIILNKTLCFMKKPNKENKKDYEEVVNIINSEYYTNFFEKDEKYIKITARLAKCYLELRDLEKCENYLKELIQIIPNDENILKLKKEFEFVKNQNNACAKKKLLDYFNHINTYDSKQTEEDAIEWSAAVENIDHELKNVKFEESVLNMFSKRDF